jgi:hypothetical protein
MPSPHGSPSLPGARQPVIRAGGRRRGRIVADPAHAGLLFGVPPHDPVTLVVVALLMAIVGTGACWTPAFRAARIDPAVALRAG